MENYFCTSEIHHITEANINFYANPFVHPRRKMREHDFIYLLEGEWKIGQNENKYTLKKDSILILSAHNTHFGISPCAAGTKTMYFHVSCNKNDGKAQKDSVVLNTLISAQGNKNIKKLFSEVVSSKQTGNNRQADLYFELLLCQLSSNRNSSEDNDVAFKIKKIIHSNPEKFYGNKELADFANVSVKTAENKFKSSFDMTIHEYILNFKIKEAISYFEIFPEISIKETAYNLGFYDEYHFSKQFKKIMGISPSNYRTEMKSK